MLRHRMNKNVFICSKILLFKNFNDFFLTKWVTKARYHGRIEFKCLYEGVKIAYNLCEDSSFTKSNFLVIHIILPFPQICSTCYFRAVHPFPWLKEMSSKDLANISEVSSRCVNDDYLLLGMCLLPSDVQRSSTIYLLSKVQKNRRPTAYWMTYHNSHRTDYRRQLFFLC